MSNGSPTTNGYMTLPDLSSATLVWKVPNQDHDYGLMEPIGVHRTGPDRSGAPIDTEFLGFHVKIPLALRPIGAIKGTLGACN
jgi:hypothetical protein